MWLEPLAIVDLETTGISALHERITEIAIFCVDEGVITREWQSLIHPGRAIPPAITALTGIDDAMVAHAPDFASVASHVDALLANRRLVAHNARFDYAFLKAAFQRAGWPTWQRPTLCTVRLSRLLLPDRPPHSLDAIAARHHLPLTGRHRAEGDARLVYGFLQALTEAFPKPALDAAARHLATRASLPSPLPADTLARLPEAPGVYLFEGDGGAPLYVGKAKNLRQRVGQHFTNDHASDTDLRLSLAARQVRHEVTAGEVSALVREIEWIHAYQPAYNRALRTKDAATAVVLDAASGKPRFVVGAAIDTEAVAQSVGLYNNRAAARLAVTEAARHARLCFKQLGLERRRPDAPCFAYQVGRCAGACIGEVTAAQHAGETQRTLTALSGRPWHHDSPFVVQEQGLDGKVVGMVFARGFFKGWVMGGDTDYTGIRAALAATDPPFDLDLYRLASHVLAKRPTGSEIISLR
jgi:DNA polymerase III subunit epsilon